MTGVTLSAAQLEYAAERLKGPGTEADLRLQDYRDVGGTFDRIVSIEMMEAVGEAYWPSYFSALRDRLKPGGLAVVQAITIGEDHFEGYRRCTDFIQHYIFPGGMLPTITEIRRQTERAGMVLRSMETFGASYARTLAEWRHRFHAAWPESSVRVSTTGSAACGSITWRIARAGSAPGRSMWGFTSWPGRPDAECRGPAAAGAGGV